VKKSIIFLFVSLFGSTKVKSLSSTPQRDKGTNQNIDRVFEEQQRQENRKSGAEEGRIMMRGRR